MVNANNNNNNDPSSHYDGQHGQDSLLKIALRHRWLILFSVILFLGLAFGYLQKATPVYTSTSRLFVEQSGPKIISDYEGVMTQSKNYIYTQAELIKSTPVISSVVDDPQIKRFKTFTQQVSPPTGSTGGIMGFIKEKLNLSSGKKTSFNIDNLVVYCKNKLDISVGKKDDLITVSFDSPYPAEAAQFVNALVDSYIKYQTSSKRSTSAEVLKILQKEKIKRDEELENNFKQLLEFTRENGAISLDNNDAHIVFKRLSKLTLALTDAQLDTISAKADYQAVLTMADEPEKVRQFALTQPSSGIRVVTNDIETQLKSQLREMQTEYKNIRLHCTEDHPSTKAVLAKIVKIMEQLDEEANKFSNAYIETMQLKLTTAKQRERELQTSFDDQQVLAKDLNVKAVQYYMLQSDLKRTEKLCDILDDRIKELNVTEDTGVLNVRILEVARPEDKPSSPQKARIMAMAMVLGLMFGGGIALLRDMTDSRLKSADEISSVLNVPVLGTVPTMSRKLSVPARGMKAHLESKSVIAEAYRTIRTALFFGSKGKIKTILITSPGPGEGKSTLISNLAITMAQARQKTLIIDADFRKPMQHNLFEIANKDGLSSVLDGEISLEDAIKPTPVEGLDLLPCGNVIHDPSETLNSQDFADILNKLCEKYDRILIDSPPVGPVTDSRILAATCDATVLVLKAEKSTRKNSQQTRDALLSVNANLLGVVVNAVSRKNNRYGYYGGYGYYGHDKKENS
jgi:succinoglycan biosynthesis transport protein ExoP